jgi:hypothetical protein
VSNHVPIRFGSINHNHRSSQSHAIALNHSRTSLDQTRWQLSYLIFNAYFPSLINCPARPAC